MLKVVASTLFVFASVLVVFSADRQDGRATQNPTAASPASAEAALDYLALSDSILEHDLVTGEELARVHLERGNCFKLLDRPVKAMQAFQAVSDLSNNLNLRAESQMRMGDIYFEQKSNSRALEFYSQALRGFEQLNNRANIVSIQFKTASIHMRNGNEELAANLLKAVIADPSVDDMRKAAAHESLGQVHYNLTEYDSCRVNFERANAIYAQYNLYDEQLQNYDFLLRSYLEQGLVNEARSLAGAAADLAIEASDTTQASIFFTQLAALFQTSGDVRQAIIYQEMALAHVAAHPAVQAVEMHHSMANLYAAANRDSEALLAFEDAEFIANTHEITTWQERIARSKADFFNRRQRYAEAFAALSIADSLQRLVLLEQVSAAKRELGRGKFTEESYLRTEDDFRTALEERQLTTMRNAIIIGIVFFTIILLLLLREFSLKRKLSKVLEWKVYKRTRELRKANKELNTYIYKSSHDLRTPLTSIKSLLRLLEKEEHNASTKKYLGLIQSCTDQMDDILVNLSRAVDYKKVDVKVEQIDFNKLRYQIQEKELANVKGIRIEWDIQEAGAFYSDFRLMKVILQQTISNAIAYRKGGEDDYCKITVYTEPSGARLTIEDNGVGIPEKVRDKVFDMFVKGTHKSTGAGLGLYLVRIAVDKIRAKVRLESEENEGCTLFFELPNLN